MERQSSGMAWGTLTLVGILGAVAGGVLYALVRPESNEAATAYINLTEGPNGCGIYPVVPGGPPEKTEYLQVAGPKLRVEWEVTNQCAEGTSRTVRVADFRAPGPSENCDAPLSRPFVSGDPDDDVPAGQSRTITLNLRPRNKVPEVFTYVICVGSGATLTKVDPIIKIERGN